MIFQFTHQLILSGEKTQTRRLRNKWDGYIINRGIALDIKSYVAHGAEGRIRWQVGKTYAVQPSRNSKSIARIKLLCIDYEDVRNISDEDVEAEGFSDRYAFLETWCKIHDPAALGDRPGYAKWTERGNYNVLQWLATRPDEKYQAWVLTFCLVTPDAAKQEARTG